MSQQQKEYYFHSNSLILVRVAKDNGDARNPSKKQSLISLEDLFQRIKATSVRRTHLETKPAYCACAASWNTGSRGIRRSRDAPGAKRCAPLLFLHGTLCRTLLLPHLCRTLPDILHKASTHMLRRHSFHLSKKLTIYTSPLPHPGCFPSLSLVVSFQSGGGTSESLSSISVAPTPVIAPPTAKIS
ncbi:hypothetical protein AVEN_234286-1 [Araneus ventricosus]|uniref:Uncharacterized protein n=1 Tax=Araneus ventricosus TaxID=182803 RepID=A0A4Y2A7Y8_ARAVE|nr:hypothetical protein AVEN_234286-1 [Araneus ventricosus]